MKCPICNSTQEVGKCPKCGSENVNYEIIVNDYYPGMVGYYPFICSDCNCKGKEWHQSMYSHTSIDE